MTAPDNNLWHPASVAPPQDRLVLVKDQYPNGTEWQGIGRFKGREFQNIEGEYRRSNHTHWRLPHESELNAARKKALAAEKRRHKRALERIAAP